MAPLNLSPDHLEGVTVTAWLQRAALPRVATVLAAVGLSLAIVAGPAARPAAAFSPSPTLVGGAVRSAPIAAAACSTGLGCVAVGVVGLGMLAYSTRDSWMPWLSDMMNADRSAPRTDGSSGCPVTIGEVSISNLLVSASYDLATSCGTWNGSTNIYGARLGLGNLRCVRADTGAIYSVSSSFQSSTATNAQSGTVSVSAACANGNDAPLDARVRVDAGNSMGTSRYVEIDWALPIDKWSAKTDVTCRRPDGSTFPLTATEVGHPERLSVPSCYASDPSSTPKDVKVTGLSGDTLLEVTNLNNYESDFPNCFGPQGMTCVTRVHVGGQPCAVGVPGCANWWLNRSNPDLEIDCRFGSYVVALANCEPLKRSYRPDAPPEGDPVTTPGGFPDPDGPYPEPTATPSPTTDPTPTTGPSTGPSGEPEPCVGAACGEGPQPDPGDGSGSCLGDAWSWNPVDWIYVPVKCVFLWAFVPKTSLSTRIDGIVSTITGKAPFSFLTGIAGFAPMIPTGTCPDWTVTVGEHERNVVCGHSYTEAIRAARPVLTAFMLALALWPLIRSTMYAAFPILKPNPGVLR